jgi:hypothetical protein
MGRPLKIQKYSAMSGIFYDNTNQGTTAQPVTIDAGYTPFAAPTAMDLPTVVYPTPTTTPLVPFTGVVGGDYTLSQPSTSYPVVQCQVNIALPNGTGQGVANGRIIRQKGARKFLVASSTNVQDEDIVQGATYQILTVSTTDWSLFGCPAAGYTNGVPYYTTGQIFTATAPGVGSGNGVALLVGVCTLYSTTPTAGNMAITMSINDSTPTYISKLTNKFAQDFNGGEAGGNSNSNNVWAESSVQNNIEYAANFFIDGEQFAKSGADVATWAGTNQNSNGTLTMAEVENFTS